jgi:Tol biopolymer transport system component
MTLVPGTRLGSYEVTAQIGVGGMGEVYRAVDTRLGRAVALKVLPASVAQDPDRLARFDREARTLAALNHPNIAAIHGLEHADGTQALVMELVEGPTLAERIAQGAIPWDDALPIARQIADALAAAHEQGIVHRDLKPANIKVRPDGTVKVLDFGLAKALEQGSGIGDRGSGGLAAVTMSPTITSPAMTQAGLILGTAAYMSPEQARGRTVDKRADIWAFGCVLYEMLTGARAFDAEDVSLTLSVVLQKEPDFAALPADVPSHVAQALRVCLRKDAKLRASDINDVRLALDGAFAPATTATARATVPVAYRWLLAAVAGVSLIVAAASTYAWWRASRQVERPLAQFRVDLGPAALLAPRQTLALSPDGTRIVFVGRGDEAGTRQLYTRRLDERTATPIAGTVHGQSLSMPFFSPAGDWIGYVAGNGVRKVPVQGGSNFLVADVSPQPLGASWGEDDHIIVASAGGLFRVPSSGGTPERMKGADSVKWFVQVLPGAKAVLVNSANLTTLSTLDDLRIDVVDIETGETKTIENGGYEPRYLPTFGSTGHLVFVRQGTLFGVPFDPQRLTTRGTPTAILSDLGNASILDGGGQLSFANNGLFVYLAGQAGTSAYPISRMDASGQTTPLVNQPGMYGAPRISPDGSRLAYTAAGSKGADVWVYDFQRDASTQLTFTGPGLREVAWALDSKHLVFGDGESLWWIRADGSSMPQKLLEKTANPRPFSFSPDGRLIYSPFGSRGLPDLWTLPIDLSDSERPKAGTPEPFLTEAFVEVDPAFSPDGKFIAYASNEFGAANDIFVRPFRGKGGKWRVSTGGGKFPAWSAQTRELFFLGGDDRIMVVSYTVTGDSFVAAAPRPWSPTQILRDGVRQSFDVAPDGKRVVMFPRPTETKNEGSLHATFLLNFFDEVRRRIP